VLWFHITQVASTQRGVALHVATDLVAAFRLVLHVVPLITVATTEGKKLGEALAEHSLRRSRGGPRGQLGAHIDI